MQLTDDELYALFVQAGFPRQKPVPSSSGDPQECEYEDRAAMMTAIALRESSGNPYAFNGNAATGDQSYGLVQINWKDANVQGRLAQLYPTRILPESLFNPQFTANAAFVLYANNRSFMNLLWYIDRPGTARDRYLALLPRAQAAAARYKG